MVLRYAAISRLSRGYRVGRCRGWRDDGEPSIDDHTRCEFTDRREIRQRRKTRWRGHRERAQFAGLHHRSCGCYRTHQHLDDPTGRVLGHLRRGAVRHLHEIEVRTAVEKLGGKRGCAGGVVETDRQLAAMGPGVVEELRHSLHRQTGVDRQHLGTEAAHHGDGGEIPCGIVRQRLERDGIDAHAGVPVRLRARHRLMGQKPGRTGHVLDHHGLSEAAANSVREQTRHDVGRGARAGGNDQPDRPNRPRVAALSLSTRRKSEDYAREDNSQ